MQSLALEGEAGPFHAYSPLWEMGAYEALWDRAKMSFKSMADLFRDHPGLLPSAFVEKAEIESYTASVVQILRESGVDRFGVRVHGSCEYPERLRDAAHPLELFYFRGNWELAYSPRAIAIVGTRGASDDGVRRAKRLVVELLKRDVTIVSGLARGIDTIAHRTAIDNGGRTIAIIGTPLSDAYPQENRDLQDSIARDHLLISQVPVYRYRRQNPHSNRLFFPERNVTMSAITDATVIVEAGETSGTLIQARAALAQGRKLFILDSCFRNASLTWPARLAERGAIRINDVDEIVGALGYS